MTTETHDYNVRDLRYVDPEHNSIDAIINHPDFGDMPYTYNTATEMESLDEHIQEAIDNGATIIAYAGSEAEVLADRNAIIEELRNRDAYLRGTDWVISKITEAQIFDSDAAVEALKTKYADIIEARADARQYINDNESLLDES